MWVRMVMGLSVAVAVFSSSRALGGISEDLVFCSKLTVRGERLACYDAAARLEKTSQSPKAKPQRDHAVTASNSPPQPRTWSGFSVGLGAAFMRTRSDSAGILTGNPGGDPLVTVGGETVSAISSFAKGTGPAMDLHAGYSIQASQSFVMGLQAELLVPAVSAGQDLQVGPCNHPACIHTFNFNGRGQFTINWMASALLKAGIATSSNNLFYALGGVSRADFASTIITTNPIMNANNQYLFSQRGYATEGWALGLGWERRIADAWSIYAEYQLNRFADFHQQSAYALGGCPGVGTCYSNTQMSGSVDLQSVRFGVN